ncbi:bifunctional alpha,alpha-trehalose-phosphate synthase (UDP-forming)/trehalose-phosphatase [Mangrovivirga cuniculi]|uniref:Alpha,alpha-trehalose-phosphate synthase n=1 Tax=Mangrovivirga cuniculi TaxID=2715131 RepID=A0A4D7JY47_9BACT|nr:bifunctional alpha,alpha-trehalose-phosphate synthase (UDP-forming)/trehalose-phosphatase [Mangrovivirga cuniculi]QCK17096.1 bifunctional alpha,alpha-trehalose-phosphate synthase (UDP-forming)/trehalose-phosphatase [Mangrovivirga cuniculi]
MSKIIIVSNRLPLRVEKKAEGMKFKPSEGGLATGLGSIYKEGDNVWVGWPGAFFSDSTEESNVTLRLKQENMLPVFLTQEEIHNYYEGFSNETLWPTYHYFSQYAVYEPEFWESYKRVNQKFADAVVSIAEKGDIVWVHDYQLLLVPQMIRDKFPDITIGFFQHIPFPSFEVFRLLPWRRELIQGMFGADLIGFHTYDDMRHFLSAVSRVVAKSNSSGIIEVGNRSVLVDSFPMGIDYDKYSGLAISDETGEREKRYRESLGDVRLILSMDRLDYSKGIPQRLAAFEAFLTNYPEYREKISLLLQVVPSRDKVEKYKKLKEEIELLVGRINGKFSRIKWTPIHYFYRSLPINAISAFYGMSDVALVTPMRDGMNLVCKEYIASKAHEGRGVLILSEMAGAAKELSDAILVNPNNQKQMVEALYRALTMPAPEQKKHLDVMNDSIKKYNIHHWVKLFMDRLTFIKEEQKQQATKMIDLNAIGTIKDEYRKADSRVLFLDYDGTLVGFNNDPKKVAPDEELVSLLDDLSKDDKNRVVVISGRDKNTLNEWLGGLDIDLICEHGVWLRERGSNWKNITKLDPSWKDQIKPVLDRYVDRTPGSFIEEKDFSLAWHYRKVETGLGEMRARELTSHLKYLAAPMDLMVLEGDMVVEIKNSQVNKGRAAQKWIEKFPAEFNLAIGDDKTDEDTFSVMPDEAFTIKVGIGNSNADYSVEDHDQVRVLLKSLL